MGNNIYTINEVAKILDKHPQTIRKYEQDFRLKIPRNEMGNRFYTEKEINIYEQIIKLKKEGLKATLIRKALTRSVDLEEQKESVDELITVERMSKRDLAEYTAMSVENLLEITLERVLENKLQEQKEQLKEEFQEKLQQQLQEQREAIVEQMTAENEQLRQYIGTLKKESVWDKIKQKFKGA